MEMKRRLRCHSSSSIPQQVNKNHVFIVQRPFDRFSLFSSWKKNQKHWYNRTQNCSNKIIMQFVLFYSSLLSLSPFLSLSRFLARLFHFFSSRICFKLKAIVFCGHIVWRERKKNYSRHVAGRHVFTVCADFCFVCACTVFVFGIKKKKKRTQKSTIVENNLSACALPDFSRFLARAQLKIGTMRRANR